MQSDNRLFDDFARLMNGAVGTLAGAGREAEGALRERMRSFVGGMDLIGRDEFDTVRDLAANARAEVDRLSAHVAALEAALAAQGTPVATPAAAPRIEPAPAATPAPTPAPAPAPSTPADDKPASFPPAGPSEPTIEEQPDGGTGRPSDFA